MSSELFEHTLREKFAEAQVPPRPELWQRIEQELGAPPPRRRGLLWWLPLLILLFVNLSVGAWYLSSLGEPETEYAAMAGPAPVAPAYSPLANKDAGSLSGEHLPGEQTQAVHQPVLPPARHSKPELQIQKQANKPQAKSVIESTSTHANPMKQAQLSPGTARELQPLQAKKATASNSEKEPSGVIRSQQDTHQVMAARLSLEAEVASNHGEVNPATAATDSLLSESESQLSLAYMQGQPYWLSDPLLQHDGSTVATAHNIALGPGRWRFLLHLQSDHHFNRFNPVLESSQLTADYLIINPNAFAIANQESIEQISAFAFPRYSVSLGLHVGYRLSYRFEVEAGINHSWHSAGIFQNGEINPYGSLSDATLRLGPTQIGEESIAYDTPSEFHYRQWEFPLSLNYTVLKGLRSAWVLQAGASFNRANVKQNLEPPNQVSSNSRDGFVFRATGPMQLQSVETASPLPSQPPLLSYRRHTLDVLGGIRYERRLNHRLGAYLGTQLRYQLIRTYAGAASVRQSPYRIGFNLGILFQ